MLLIRIWKVLVFKTGERLSWFSVVRFHKSVQEDAGLVPQIWPPAAPFPLNFSAVFLSNRVIYVYKIIHNI